MPSFGIGKTATSLIKIMISPSVSKLNLCAVFVNETADTGGGRLVAVWQMSSKDICKIATSLQKVPVPETRCL